jgi:hypothetical protein
VDPTSPFTGGALLGDRIRMESVALDDGVYIRSMASRGSLGGLATSTREVSDLLDAAGFDRIVIETVGVGQSELDVARMADSTVLVLVPESGDGIQTLKSGVMEAADARAPTSCAARSRSPSASAGATPIGTCRRTTGTGRNGGTADRRNAWLPLRQEHRSVRSPPPLRRPVVPPSRRRRGTTPSS